MRIRGLLLAGTATAVLGLAMPAAADVTIIATVTKDKDIFVTETLTKVKDVDVVVTATLEPDGAAEAEAIANVLNDGNEVGGGPDADNFGLEKDAVIDTSINTNQGIVGVNQDSGNAVNQANIVSVALTDSDSSFTDSGSFSDQRNLNNSAAGREELDVANPDHAATITGSVLGNAGIVGVNQNTGNMNNQTNTVALAVGIGSIAALSEAALGQENTGNTVDEINTVKFGTIQNSGNNNQGIVSINQSNGNMNNQGTTIAFSALTSSAAIGNVPAIP